VNGSASSNGAPVIEQGRDLPSDEGKTMKKIEIRKTGPVRLTSAAHPLYIPVAAAACRIGPPA
jgi:hypothetical protein